MEPIFADPKTELVVKRIFGGEVHNPLLIKQLNALLEFTGDHRDARGALTLASREGFEEGLRQAREERWREGRDEGLRQGLAEGWRTATALFAKPSRSSSMRTGKPSWPAWGAMS